MTVLPTSVEEIRKNVGSRQDVNQNRIYTHHAPPTKTEKENVQKWVGSQNDGLYEYKDVLMIGIKIYHTYHFDENIKKKVYVYFFVIKKRRKWCWKFQNNNNDMHPHQKNKHV